MPIPVLILLLGLLLTQVNPASGVEFPVHIERGEFVDAAGRPFVPRGFNYIRLFPGRSHDTFDPEHYDPDTIERVLQRWQTDGFNLVRVFLNGYAHLQGSIAHRDVPGLDAAYVRNVADFLVRARRHGIAVMICAESFPRTAPYAQGLHVPEKVSSANAEYLDIAHVEAKAAYLQDLIRKLSEAQPGCLEAVFSYDLQNELCFQVSEPFANVSGAFIVAEGKHYQLPGQRQELADDAAVHFIDRMADSIHQVHPKGLVNVSVFTYRAVGRSGPGDFQVKKAAWQNRIPVRPMAILRSKADIVDLHLYPGDEQAFESDLASIEFSALTDRAKELGKPVIVGEFGVFKSRFPELPAAATWIGEMTSRIAERGFAGWLYWTYDTHEQDSELWHACDGESAIYQILKSRR